MMLIRKSSDWSSVFLLLQDLSQTRQDVTALSILAAGGYKMSDGQNSHLSNEITGIRYLTNQYHNETSFLKRWLLLPDMWGGGGV